MKKILSFCVVTLVFMLSSCGKSAVFEITNLSGGSHFSGYTYYVYDDGTALYEEMEADEIINSETKTLQWTQDGGLVFDFDSQVVVYFDPEQKTFYLYNTETGADSRDEDAYVGAYISYNKVDWDKLETLLLSMK